MIPPSVYTFKTVELADVLHMCNLIRADLRDLNLAAFVRTHVYCEHNESVY